MENKVTRAVKEGTKRARHCDSQALPGDSEQGSQTEEPGRSQVLQTHSALSPGEATANLAGTASYGAAEMTFHQQPHEKTPTQESCVPL